MTTSAFLMLHKAFVDVKASQSQTNVGGGVKSRLCICNTISVNQLEQLDSVANQNGALTQL